MLKIKEAHLSLGFYSKSYCLIAASAASAAHITEIKRDIIIFFIEKLYIFWGFFIS